MEVCRKMITDVEVKMNVLNDKEALAIVLSKRRGCGSFGGN